MPTDALAELNAINDWEENSQMCLQTTSEQVMAAYQNANKWLDSTKEMVYTDLSCPFFSSWIHALAHTMPGRFDKFGDILHTVNMKIPYPATAGIPKEPQNIDEVFDMIFLVLDNIKASLNAFIKCTAEEYHGMSCAAETCLNDIESEYPMLYRLQKKWEQCNNNIVEFDKYVMQYVEHKDDLLESVNNKKSKVLVESTSNGFKFEQDKDHVKVTKDGKFYGNYDTIEDAKCAIDAQHEDEDYITDSLYEGKFILESRMPLHLQKYAGMSYDEFQRAYQENNYGEPSDIDRYEWDEMNDIDTGMEWTGSKFIDDSDYYDDFYYDFDDYGINDSDYYDDSDMDESINEDTVKLSKGTWANKGSEGIHGKFDTKKEADAQRKAMFANGYHESLDEDDSTYEEANTTMEELADRYAVIYRDYLAPYDWNEELTSADDDQELELEDAFNELVDNLEYAFENFPEDTISELTQQCELLKDDNETEAYEELSDILNKYKSLGTINETLDEARFSVQQSNDMFFASKGFNPQGKGFVALGKTFDIKDELKANGAKYNPDFKLWIMPQYNSNFQSLEISIDDLYEADQRGSYYYGGLSADAQTTLNRIQDENNKIIQAAKANQPATKQSEYVGQLGERIKIPNIVNSKFLYSYEAQNLATYRYSEVMILVYKFTDADGHVFIWATQKDFEDNELASIGMIVGTVKDQREYKGEKQTVLSRCRLFAKDGSLIAGA